MFVRSFVRSILPSFLPSFDIYTLRAVEVSLLKLLEQVHSARRGTKGIHFATKDSVESHEFIRYQGIKVQARYPEPNPPIKPARSKLPSSHPFMPIPISTTYSILIWRAVNDGALGRLIARTPFLSEALTFTKSMRSGNWNVRSNEP